MLTTARRCFAPGLSEAARGALIWQAPLPLTDAHRCHLAWHRAHVFLAEGVADLAAEAHSEGR